MYKLIFLEWSSVYYFTHCKSFKLKLDIPDEIISQVSDVVNLLSVYFETQENIFLKIPFKRFLFVVQICPFRLFIESKPFPIPYSLENPSILHFIQEGRYFSVRLFSTGPVIFKCHKNQRFCVIFFISDNLISIGLSPAEYSVSDLLVVIINVFYFVFKLTCVTMSHVVSP